jgi:hypothetical protein
MNTPSYTDEDIKNRKVDYDMSIVYGIPFIERTILQYAVRDKCFREITKYEDTRFLSTYNDVHPKESLPEAREVLRCFVKNIQFEPVCNKAFNEARECLFRTKVKFGYCQSELDMFESCKNDPVAYQKFIELGTKVQNSSPHYFGYLNQVHK